MKNMPLYLGHFSAVYNFYAIFQSLLKPKSLAPQTSSQEEKLNQIVTNELQHFVEWMLEFWQKFKQLIALEVANFKNLERTVTSEQTKRKGHQWC
ncbi:hypothetical protein EG68_10655 [Paragonimus skrjabini miyazakii]|uniref:Uncharacterized protein n=1 Tax=Paragonimus skrjabini miyazakii TaxID=59628 RepID=A0A8S9YY35_9TREM|nr:hypothetical protein EG68_10655 [Paragonimus skrjabini miyazakii]